MKADVTPTIVTSSRILPRREANSDRRSEMRSHCYDCARICAFGRPIQGDAAQAISRRDATCQKQSLPLGIEQLTASLGNGESCCVLSVPEKDGLGHLV